MPSLLFSMAKPTLIQVIADTKMNDYLKQLQTEIAGDIDTSDNTKLKFRHDTIMFEITPQAVIYPKNTKDVKTIIEFGN